jgi:hypothetical protein
MAVLPDLFRRYTTELWYILLAPFFFFVFMLVWTPFHSEAALDMGRGLFVFNVTMMMCIAIFTIFILRTIRFLLRDHLNRSWWALAAWNMLELTAITYFFALYLYLMDPSMPYFNWLARCVPYSFLVLLFPYASIGVVCGLIAVSQSLPAEKDLIRFATANRQVRLVLIKDAVLYVQAQENYVRICYLENGHPKDYVLRSTMVAIAPLMEHYGFIRCHRSYFVNPSHIVALRRDRDDVFSAELDIPDTVLPISKRVYQEMSQRL